jgi:hypothetical protein
LRPSHERLRVALGKQAGDITVGEFHGFQVIEEETKGGKSVSPKFRTVQISSMDCPRTFPK